MKNSKWLILGILVVAAILRLWKLGSIPPHLTPDEASLGYNAYSILKTGGDEYGEFLPIIFKSFGDYKPGFYVYFTVPFVAILGLTEFAVRLPSALSGIIAVWLVYKIIVEFFTKEKSQLLANLAPFMLAISPWHIHFSRGAWEANLSLTLTLAGIYFFLKSFKNSRFLVLASIFFSSTLLTYQGAKPSTTIVILILIIVFWREAKILLESTKIFLAATILVGALIALPVVLSFSQGKTGRLEIFSVFSYPRSEEYLQNFLDKGNERVGNINYYVFHSEKLNFLRGIMGRWFNHFSGRYLFFEGDYQNPRHSAPNHGMMFFFDLVLLPLGLIALTKQKSKPTTFLIIWVILAPLPAVLSRDQVHSVRALNLVIPLTVLSSLGFFLLYQKIETLRFSKLIFSILFFLLLANFIYFIDAYFVHIPKHNSKYWEYGYKQVVETVNPLQSQYKEIKVQQSFAQPYIYFLFFLRYDPSKYQKQARLVESEYKGDVGYIEKLDNISFSPIDWPQNKREHGVLFIADSIRIPEEELLSDSVNLIKEIEYMDGGTTFRIVEVK